MCRGIDEFSLALDLSRQCHFNQSAAEKHTPSHLESLWSRNASMASQTPFVSHHFKHISMQHLTTIADSLHRTSTLQNSTLGGQSLEKLPKESPAE